MTRYYLAGPMSGIENLNFPAFHREAAYLRGLGHEIVSPAEVNVGADALVASGALPPEQHAEHWTACMRRDIVQLVACDGIFMMPGWERSKGASLEHYIARQLGLRVVYLQREAVAA